MRNEDQKIVEFENDSVSKLLGGLKRVEAPGDFDFRVKARIALRRSGKTSASWMPASVRVVVPAGVLVLVGAYFGFNALFSGPPAAQQTSIAGAPPISVAPVNNAPPQEVAAVPSSETAVAPPVVKTPGASRKTNDSQPEKPISRPGRSTKDSGGRSLDTALSIVRTLSSNLSQLGIGVSYVGSSRVVTSVKQGSIAERSGLKTGDVIEAVTEKSLRVRRDGKSMQIDLKP